MDITLLSVPYHLGREGTGMGLGPRRYLDAGLAARLEARGHDVEVAEVRRPGPFEDELGAVVAVNGVLADAVAAARARGALPVVAGGNCNVVLGMTAGLGAAETAVVWFDAHGDFNTPATTPSGFLDGMPLAIACGVAHPDAWAWARGAAVDPRACVHVGGRDLDPGEVANLAASGVRVVGVEGLRDGLAGALAAAPRADRAYLHVDLDVLDPAYAPAVDFPSPGGLTPDELVDAAGVVAARIPVGGLSVTAYDPERDDEAASTLAAGLDLIDRLVATVAA